MPFNLKLTVTLALVILTTSACGQAQSNNKLSSNCQEIVVLAGAEMLLRQVPWNSLEDSIKEYNRYSDAEQLTLIHHAYQYPLVSSADRDDIRDEFKTKYKSICQEMERTNRSADSAKLWKLTTKAVRERYKVVF